MHAKLTAVSQVITCVCVCVCAHVCVCELNSLLNNGELSPMAESPECKTSYTVINTLHTHILVQNSPIIKAQLHSLIYSMKLCTVHMMYILCFLVNVFISICDKQMEKECELSTASQIHQQFRS